MRPLLAIPLLLLAPTSALAGELTTAALAKAIDKGVAWLRKQAQDPGGPFTNARGIEANYLVGRVSLGVLTLLKCGASAKDPDVVKAFAFLHQRKVERVYDASVLALAIEARYRPTSKDLKDVPRKGYPAVAKKVFKKRARPEDKKLLKACITFLVKNRARAVWRYPKPADDGVAEDHSNTQYAMLALKTGRRLGYKVPLELFEKVADHFVKYQDADGADVSWFGVPAADGAIYDMLPPARREKRIARDRKQARKRGGTSQRGPNRKETRKLLARGWSYLPRKPGQKPKNDEELTSGSMTASGIAALCIAKSELERSAGSWGPRRERVNRAIRDGCAWMAHWFSPKVHPTGRAKYVFGNYHYYYLYGVERAGVLAGTYRFGKRDWWDEGAAWLLGQQEGWGAWPKGPVLSDFVNTCFALLFLRRATIPLVPLPPKRVMTGRHR